MISPKHAAACLITTLDQYPAEVLEPIQKAGFHEILIFTNCPSVSGRLDVFRKARTEFIFTQDDDSLSPITFLLGHADPSTITTVMHPGHIEFYAPRRHCLMNWGAVFPMKCLQNLDHYLGRFGDDAIFKREFDRIFTGLNFPQTRIPYPVTNLPRSADSDRVSMDPKHFEFMREAESRLGEIATTPQERRHQEAI